MPRVLVLSTLATKRAETEYLSQRLRAFGADGELIDISLETGGKIVGGEEKCLAMTHAVNRTLAQVSDAVQGDAEVVIGLGGGTGGEIVLQVLQALPITFPKILVTTLPFDARFVVSDNAIILVPTLVDVCGLNTILREALINTAAMAAGLCRKERKGELKDIHASIGITALGVTNDAVSPLVRRLQGRGRECTVFHANGFGGAAFARFADNNAFSTIIDLTPHEITRIKIAGTHVNMPKRFTAGSHLPRITLPGALNFIGLGELALIPERYAQRPHYAHSGFFTHVQITPEEMEIVARSLARSLGAARGPQAIIVPMGGFSHQDCPGGIIENKKLRGIFLEIVRATVRNSIRIIELDAHINDAAVTRTIVETLPQLAAEFEDLTHGS